MEEFPVLTFNSPVVFVLTMEVAVMLTMEVELVLVPECRFNLLASPFALIITM